MTFFDGWWDPATTGDTTGPTITLIDPPEPDLEPGDSVVIDITDSGGFSQITILARGAGITGTQAVYTAGAYVTPFAGTAAAITDGFRFTFSPSSGWQAGEIDIIVIAIDASGNLTSDVFEWDVELATDSTGYTPFRDAVWRWRRRLHRQKCSVISVAIDDAYSPGPGFVLTALALEVAIKPGLDRVPWRDGTSTNPGNSGSNSDGT